MKADDHRIQKWRRSNYHWVISMTNHQSLKLLGTSVTILNAPCKDKKILDYIYCFNNDTEIEYELINRILFTKFNLYTVLFHIKSYTHIFGSMENKTLQKIHYLFQLFLFVYCFYSLAFLYLTVLNGHFKYFVVALWCKLCLGKKISAPKIFFRKLPPRSFPLWMIRCF